MSADGGTGLCATSGGDRSLLPFETDKEGLDAWDQTH